MATNINTILSWFKTGLKPTQEQFGAAWTSFWHKDEKIPQSSISDLTTVLNAKVEKDQFDAHLTDSNAHVELLSGVEEKKNKGIAGGYAPLNEFTKIANQYLNIIDDLTTGGSTSILSAQQGVVLQGQIAAINTLLSSDNINLDTVQEIVDAILKIQSDLNNISVNDATTLNKGILKLAGDLAGTSDLPTVPELANKMNLYAEVVNLPANYTFQLGDEKKFFVYDGVTNVNAVFEKNSVTAFPIGSKISIYVKNTGAVTPIFSFPATNINNTVYLSKIVKGEKRSYTKVDVDTWIADSDLGVTVATDAETQISATVTEDNKAVSRLKLFNWWVWQKTLNQGFTSVQVSQFQKSGSSPLYIRVNNFTSDVLNDLRIYTGNDNAGSPVKIPFFQRCIVAGANKGSGTWERAVSTIKVNNTNPSVATLSVNITTTIPLGDADVFVFEVDELASKTGAQVGELISTTGVKDVDDKTTNTFRVTFDISYDGGGGDGTLELALVNPSGVIIDKQTESINIDSAPALNKKVVFRLAAVKTSDNNVGYTLRLSNGSKALTGWRLTNILRTNN